MTIRLLFAGLAVTAAILPISPASAYHLIKTPYKNERIDLTKQDPCNCGTDTTPVCYTKKNQSWACMVRGKKDDCSWHPKGPCDPLKSDGTDVSATVSEK
jgi:hypothetical protein